MFSLSDLVICINNTRLAPDLLACPLILGQEYEVLGLKKCRCGIIYVDIGLSLTSERYDIVCQCARRFNDGTWWFHAARFEPRTSPAWQAVKAAATHPN